MADKMWALHVELPPVVLLDSYTLCLFLDICEITYGMRLI